MIPKIKKILFANDLSYNSKFALAYSVSLAGCYGSKVIVLHVLEEISESLDNSLAPYFGESKWKSLKNEISSETIELLEKRVVSFCKETNEEMGQHTFQADEIIVKTGKPSDVIILEAEKNACDLIIMGTHGHGGFKETLMGSNSKRVIRKSKIPVLVIPLP
ncbi:MAG: universal stress protein [Desulfobacterales bacterium]|nr:universal stress protein [Desulfobacterales bacterium]MDD4071977.1 universal stress protein [Desulfobacterales bacterium]MDD4391719.1 universal stress protein [Desulfobacterales bacterium]